MNALQTLSKAQLLQQLGRTGRMDQGVHITMMSHDQNTSQMRSTDLAQLEESDISPMILRSHVAGRSFARLPFLCPPHPVAQARTKEKMFLHNILDKASVENWRGYVTSCMDLPCKWAHESVLVLHQMFNEHKEAFPQAPKRHFGSPGCSTLLLHSVWIDRCLVKLPTGEYVSLHYGGSWTLERSSLVHCPTTIIALNRTIRDGVSYVSCLTPIPE